MIKIEKAEPWESKQMRRLMLVYAAAGAAGDLVVVLVVLIFRALNWGEVSSGILFVPWMVAGLLLVPTAFHRGVVLGRARRGQGDELNE